MKLFTIIVALGLVAIVWMNSAVDVAGLRTFDTVWDLARRQQPDELLVWETLFDQRAWLKAKLVKSGACPDLLVLGSSTVGKLESDMFPGRGLLNGWLSAPTIEDLEAATQVMDEAHCHPAAIVLGVDSWLLNAAFVDQRWLSWSDDAVAYRGVGPLRRLGITAGRDWSVFKERLNFATTRETVAALWERWRGTRPSTSPRLVAMSPDAYCQTISEVQYIRANDGHYVSCPSFIRPPAEVDAGAHGYVTNNTNQIAVWKAIDPDRRARLDALVRRWIATGSRVVIVAPPYHPAAWAAIEGNAQITAMLGAADHALAALGAHYLDLRDAATSGCAASEFEDGHHVALSCARKVAQRIASAL